jgi:hypothetical protein
MCPKNLYLDWIAEGDPAGTPYSGEEWGWFMGGGPKPPIGPGDRLYVCSWGYLRGWAPVTRLAQTPSGWAICRGGGAVACTLRVGCGLKGAEYERSVQVGPPPDGICRIDGFRGWRKVWWPREAEVPFPDWMTYGLPAKELLRFARDGNPMSSCHPMPSIREKLGQVAG